MPGYRLHLESERRSVKVETWVTEGVRGVLHQVFCAGDFIVLFSTAYIVYLQEMSPELLGSWQNTAPCERWGTDLGTFLTMAKSICYLSDIAGCLCVTWGLIPSEIPNGRCHCREHSVCCVLQQLGRSRALQCSPEMGHGGCCAVGYGQEPEREIYRLDFEPKLWFDLNFYPSKICSWKKLHLFLLLSHQVIWQYMKACRFL